MLRTIHADDEFSDLDGRSYETATLAWTVEDGTDCRPFQTIGHISFGEGRLVGGFPSGLASGVTVESFGRVKLLAQNGALVKPGDVLAEIEERPPRLEEWEQERGRATDAVLKAQALEHELANPFRAFAYSLRRSLRRER